MNTIVTVRNREEDIYTGMSSERAEAMTTRATRGLLFATYQLTVLLGVLFMPVALLVRRLGVPVPLDRVVSRLGDAVEER